MKITVWHNIARDENNRPLGLMDGYRVHQPLVPVAMISSSALSIHGPALGAGGPSIVGRRDALLEWVFELYNVGEGGLARDYRQAGNRSLSVGDVVQFSTRPDTAPVVGTGDVWYACGSTGWEPVNTPLWFAIGASVYGSTSVDEANFTR